MTDEFQFDDSFDDSFDDFTDTGTKSRVKSREFDAQVKKHIHQLNTAKEAAKRRESAFWLGESGEPKAITALVKTFKKDKEKTVRDAAKYALGMFKALEKALDDDKERARAAELLDKVVNQGEMGGRTSLSNKMLLRLHGVFVVTLILIGGLAFLLPPKTPGTTTIETVTPTQVAAANGATPTPDLLKAVADVRDLLAKIRQDASAMQRQFLNLQTGTSIDCAITFNDPTPLSADIAAGNTDLMTLIAQLNSARNDLIAARDTFSRLCQTDPTPVATLAPSDVTAPLDAVTSLLRSLAGLDDQINAVETAIQSIPTPLPFTETPSVTPSETSTPTPTATIAPATINNHILALEAVLQNVTGLRGPSTLLTSYWTDAQTAGITDACTSPTPAIPGDYPPLEEALGQSVPQLKQAADQVNLSLGLLRQGWELFRTACANNTLRDSAALGQQYASAAEAGFSSVVSVLDALRDSMR